MHQPQSLARSWTKQEGATMCATSSNRASVAAPKSCQAAVCKHVALATVRTQVFQKEPCCTWFIVQQFSRVLAIARVGAA